MIKNNIHHSLKYCIITNDVHSFVDKENIEAVGFYQWLNVFNGQIFRAGNVLHSLKDNDFDIIHVRLIPGNIEIIHSIRSIIGEKSKTKLVVSMDMPVKYWEKHSYDLDKLSHAAKKADFVFATEYTICRSLETLVNKPVYEMPYPADLKKIRSCVSQDKRENNNIINILYKNKINNFIWMRWFSKRFNFKIRVIFYKDVNEEMIEKLARNKIETIVCKDEADFCKALNEGMALIAPYGYSNYGKWIIYAAALGTIVIGNQLLDASRRCYPFLYTNIHSIRACYKAISLHRQSREMLDYIRENALCRVEHYNWQNMKNRFLALITKETGDNRFDKYFVTQNAKENSPVFLRDTRYLFGKKAFEQKINDLAVVCLVKNGMDHMAAFMDHYNALGVKHFVFIDNYSTDGTVEFLRNRDNVTVYQTKLLHKQYESEIRRTVIESLFDNRWCLCVDIDELFDYPYSNKISLGQFLDYLNKYKFTAAAAYMLDMFTGECDDYLNEKKPLTERYCYYDISEAASCEYFQHNPNFCNYNILSDESMKLYYGGIRRKHFGSEIAGNREIIRYVLIKHPLMFVDRKIEPVTDPHFCNKAYIADVSCLLKHYKFTDGFKMKLDNAIHNYSYFGKIEHEEYASVLNNKEKIDFYSEASKKLENVNDLVESGFLKVSARYLDFVKN